MKYIYGWMATGFLCMAMPSWAQYGNYSEADMQRMMENAQKGMMQAQQCFANIDQAAVQALAESGKAMEQKIASLCKAGKDAEAQREAMSFARQVSVDPNVTALRKCGEQMRGMMPEIPFADFDAKSEGASQSGGICAGYGDGR